jgi:hypothetical protein
VVRTNTARQRSIDIEKNKRRTQVPE